MIFLGVLDRGAIIAALQVPISRLLFGHVVRIR